MWQQLEERFGLCTCYKVQGIEVGVVEKVTKVRPTLIRRIVIFHDTTEDDRICTFV